LTVGHEVRVNLKDRVRKNLRSGRPYEVAVKETLYGVVEPVIGKIMSFSDCVRGGEYYLFGLEYTIHVAGGVAGVIRKCYAAPPTRNTSPRVPRRSRSSDSSSKSEIICSRFSRGLLIRAPVRTR